MNYKKAILLLVILLAVLSFTACSSTQLPEEYDPPYDDTAETEDIAVDEPAANLPAPDTNEAIKPPFEGKIAIITEGFGSQDFFLAYPLMNRYGKDKVMHVLWPFNYHIEPEEVVNNILLDLGSDLKTKAIIINPPLWSVSAALENLFEKREDIIVIYLAPNLFSDDESGYLKTANLVLKTDMLNIGSSVVVQAKKLGAETFVHYSYPSPSYEQFDAKIHNLIKNKCVELGIEFVHSDTPDPWSGANFDGDGVKQFIKDDVPKMVKKYSKNTAFFSTSCLLQTQLVEAVLDTGAIYPSPCCPYPFYRYPYEYYGVMDLAWDIYSRKYTESSKHNGQDFITCIENAIAHIRADLEGKGDLNRLSTWPVFDTFMYASTATEYAIKWINGEVPKEGVDVDVLKQLMKEYAGVEVYLTPFVDDGTHDYYERESEPTGETYDNFLLMTMDYVTFEELGVKGK